MNWKCFFGFHKWGATDESTYGKPWRFCSKCGGKQEMRKCSASDQWIWHWIKGDKE